jgi:hypothetical protein
MDFDSWIQNHPVVNADYIPPHWNETICYVLSAIREVVKKKCKIVDLNKTSKFRDAGQQGKDTPISHSEGRR